MISRCRLEDLYVGRAATESFVGPPRRASSSFGTRQRRHFFRRSSLDSEDANSTSDSSRKSSVESKSSSSSNKSRLRRQQQVQRGLPSLIVSSMTLNERPPSRRLNQRRIRRGSGLDNDNDDLNYDDLNYEDEDDDEDKASEERKEAWIAQVTTDEADSRPRPISSAKTSTMAVQVTAKK